MNEADNKRDDHTTAGLGVTGERKRADARRRFLRGATAGSGLLIITVYHQRAFAGKKVLVSSVETCASLTGTPKKGNDGSKTKKVIDAETGQKVDAYVCADVPEYKLPRKKLK